MIVQVLLETTPSACWKTRGLLGMGVEVGVGRWMGEPRTKLSTSSKKGRPLMWSTFRNMGIYEPF
jgi:hypothetical protein